jgi:6-phosphofructo-2-kinase/fructose-2,6-biphosphatase 2
MCKWFAEGRGLIAILDATNSTKTRRRWIQERCAAENIETLYVESKCDDEELIMSNILEVKTTSPDYVGQDPEEAAADFRNRIRNYEKVYETIDEDERDLTYVKLIDVGKQVIINQIQDYLQSRVVYYLMNLHIKPRSIWLSRASPSIYINLFLLLTIIARRIPIQPVRTDRRRRRPLGTRRCLRTCASRSCS